MRPHKKSGDQIHELVGAITISTHHIPSIVVYGTNTFLCHTHSPKHLKLRLTRGSVWVSRCRDPEVSEIHCGELRNILFSPMVHSYVFEENGDVAVDDRREVRYILTVMSRSGTFWIG